MKSCPELKKEIPDGLFEKWTSIININVLKLCSRTSKDHSDLSTRGADDPSVVFCVIFWIITTALTNYMKTMLKDRKSFIICDVQDDIYNLEISIGNFNRSHQYEGIFWNVLCCLLNDAINS